MSADTESSSYTNNDLSLVEVTVTDITQLSGTVKGYELSTIPASLHSLAFHPGQWVDIHIPDTIVSGYSITSSPAQFNQSDRLQLAIQYTDHPPTHWMYHNCTVGTKIRVCVGGAFRYDPAPLALSDLLLVAGGIGINPLFSVLKHQHYLMSQCNGTARIPGNRLLYTARSCNELIFKKEMDELVASKKDKFKCQYFSTKEAVTDGYSNVANRRLTETDISNMLDGLDHTHLECYICGPPTLITFVSETLLKLGVEEKAIQYEQW